MSLRVVHVASGREWRGGQRQVWLLARELEHLGVSQTVVTGTGTELATRLRAAGVRVRETGWSLGLDPRVLGAVVADLRAAPAVLHAHDAHALTLAGLAARLTGAPLVVTRRVDFPLRRRGLWARADRVIAISDAVARVLRADGIPAGRIVVIHSGVDLADIEAAVPLGLRARLGLPPGAVVAAHLGALVPHKDQATLVRAAGLLRERVPALYWIIAGEGELRSEVETLIAREALSDRVRLVGQLERPLGLLAEADLFVMSSREEGLGTSVLDAMARGIPVASTSAGGLPEMLAGIGLLVPPGDPSALADAVARLAVDPALRAELGARGRARVRQFTAARMADAVRTVYRSFAQDD